MSKRTSDATASNASMQGKTCLVTGATSGIGRVTARVLAERGAEVVLLARNRQRAEDALAEIRRAAGHERVSYLLADFASLRQVRAAAAAFRERFSTLDVLVNNAGAFFLRRGLTEDGFERTFAVNHLAPFLLTNLLLEPLLAAAPARVVTVASEAHEQGRIHWDDLSLQRGYGGMRAYAQSKLANVLFAFELARRLAGRGVTSNALHPGFVATNIGADSVPLVGPLIKAIINRRAVDVETGAQTSIYLASSPEVEGVTGEYFVDCRPVPAAPAARDESAAARLWEVSAAMVGLADR